MENRDRTPAEGQGKGANAQRPAAMQGNAKPQRVLNAQRTPGGIRPIGNVRQDSEHEAQYAMPPRKKKRKKKNRLSLLGIVITVVIAASLLAGGTIATLLALGYRYVEQPFSDSLYGNYTIRFLGKVDGNGEILEGRLYYDDGSKAQISGNNGVFKIEYANGDIYEGGLKDYQKNGEGKMTCNNGDVYEGAFLYDDFWGKGKYTFANGDVYNGDFVAGKKSGSGIYRWAANASGNYDVYEGGFENDMRNGEGIFNYADGSVYEGKYNNDKRNDSAGKFTLARSDGTKDVYEGSFVNDVRSGYGVYTWANGEVYRGNFINNLMDTRKLDENGSFIKDSAGNFEFGEQGTISFLTGRTYKADFMNGEMYNETQLTD